jgi:hypothetical protein
MTTSGVECDTGVAKRIVEEVGDRTQDIILLAQETFRIGVLAGKVSSGSVEAAATAVVTREADRFRAVWDGLARNQKLVVRALAAGVANPFAHGSLPDVPRSTVQRALGALRDKQVLLDAPSAYRLDDPYFALWVRKYAMADSVPQEFME